jgi:methylated-DNA-[protein]-cysteine S-methyltransferase
MEHVITTQIGPLAVVVDEAGTLTRLSFAGSRRATPRADTVQAVAALEAYFAGDLGALDDVTVAPAYGSSFQRHVWKALRSIPIGETASYADIALEVGVPGAGRAVGRANATNPIAVVVPCHRVIRSDGSLGGYGGGLVRKRWLLAHEGAFVSELALGT